MDGISSADVLIIGGGLAGLAAAVAAKRSQPDADVCVIDKCEIAKSGGSVQAKGFAAVGRWSLAQDSTELHLADMLNAGCGINDEGLARMVVEGIGQIVDVLEKMGVVFDTKDAHRYAKPNATWVGHRHYRHIGVGDSTGKVLLDAMRREAHRRGVSWQNDVFALKIAISERGALGLVAYVPKRGALIGIRAKTLIIATGGDGYLFARTTNPPQVTGDGLWLAYEAGAELMDMEMVQFYPVNYVYPLPLRGKNVGSYRDSKIYNAFGERFMSRYDPENLENATRDTLSRAIAMEIMAGRGTPHGGVYIDRTGLEDAYYQQFSVEVQTCLEGGLDVRTQRGEVGPAAHYLMGGIRIDHTCKTSVPFLLAAGEVIAGIHGANRLANNSLSDALVLGCTAGKTAVSLLEQSPSDPFLIDCLEDCIERETQGVEALLANREGHYSPQELRSAIRSQMWKNVGVIRSKSGLEKALAFFDGISETDPPPLEFSCISKRANYQLIEGLEALRMLEIGRITALSALEREESRGAHFRENFPWTKDPDWRKHIVVRKQLNACNVSFIPVDVVSEICHGS